VYDYLQSTFTGNTGTTLQTGANISSKLVAIKSYQLNVITFIGKTSLGSYAINCTLHNLNQLHTKLAINISSYFTQDRELVHRPNLPLLLPNHQTMVYQQHHQHHLTHPFASSFLQSLPHPCHPSPHHQNHLHHAIY